MANNSQKSEKNLLNPPLSVEYEYAQQKLSEFSSTFSSICRIPLLRCEGVDKENVFYQLITLKKNIKYALEELGKGCSKQDYNFTCGICDAPITVKAGQDFWSGLQAHEHFEKLVCDMLENKLTITYDKTNGTAEPKQVLNGGDSNTDSGIDQPENETLSNDNSPNGDVTRNHLSDMPSTSRQQKSKEEDVNSFRFNFPVRYHDSVASKIYPSRMMEGVQKFDKVKEYYTIQKCGPSKATCLVCPCELNSPRVNKKVLTNHAMGARHMRATVDHRNLKLLRDYHEFWLKEDEFMQAHSVYFNLYSKNDFICVLCNVYVGMILVRSHCHSNNHKSRVMQMYKSRNTSYHLLYLQVQLYGIVPEEEPKERVEEENPERIPNSSKNEAKKNRSLSEQSAGGQSQEDKERKKSLTHAVIKSVLDKESTNIFDLIPNRLKDEAKHFKSIKKNGARFIQCNLCMVEIPEKLDLLKEHIIFTVKHSKARKEKYSFLCDICNKREPTEVMWYKHNWRGPRHENMAESRKVRVTEYECTTCKTVLFGDELSLKRHLSIGDKSGKKRDRAPKLPDQLKTIFKNAESMLAEAGKLKNQADEAQLSNRTQECCEKIQSALREIYIRCRVYPFGSRVTGIGNQESDLDVFVDIGNMYTGEQQQDARDQVLIIRHAAKAFTKRETPPQWSHIVKVDTARTPILKLHHVPTNLDCDLSFRHGLSVENTKFLRLCMDLEPNMQQLVMLVKKWAEHLNYENISTYALVMMAIFYLQINKHLLSVETIRQMEKCEHATISGWKTLAHSMPLTELKKHVTPYPHKVPDLAKSFFEYYAKFDFNTYVACPLLGRVVLKSHFLEQHGRQLPPEMDTYLDQLDGEDPEYFRANSLMCIQDPFDLSHNLTKAVQQGTLSRFQTMCKMTAEHIDLKPDD